MPFDQESEQEIRKLLKAATVHKRQGDWDAAIRSLQQANQIAKANRDRLDTKSRLRLPKYFAHAGHRDRAWAEFSLVLEEVCGCGKGEWVISIELSEVYREMARFLRDERRFRDAFIHELLSLHFWGRSRSLSYKYESERARALSDAESKTPDQMMKELLRRNCECASSYASENLKELRGILSKEGIEEFLDEKLHDDEDPTMKPTLTALFQREVESLPEFDLSRLIEDAVLVLRGVHGGH